MHSNILIIGGGHAGGMLSIALRKNKYSGSITIVGEEPYLPYQRPPLSKNYLDGKINHERILLKSIDFYKKNAIELMTNQYAESVNINKSMVKLKNGKNLSFDNLIFATGSVMKKIKYKNQEDIHYLRTIDDSKLLREQLGIKKSLVIIGGGYIGLEIASIAIKKNLKVTVLEIENRLLKRNVCSQISDFFAEKHRKAGVNICLDKVIENISKDQKNKNIVCKDGEIIPADFVIAGIGVKPNTLLAENAGIKCEDGVLVNEFCQTSETNIFAIGDCANHISSFSGERIRLESVQNAVDQAMVVSSFIIGEKKPYTNIPWFWSDQYDVKLKIIGINKGYDQTVMRGSVKNEKFAIFYLKNKRLIAADTINNPKDFSLAKKLINQGTVSGNEFDLV